MTAAADGHATAVGRPEAGFGLYVHWPFCAAKCPYCDFNSHVADGVDARRWTRAYLSELRRNAALMPGRRLDSVFFGGGTPSLMDPAITAAVLAEAARLWPMARDAEITLEANPTSVESARFALFRDAGVNRISIGIQSLVDEDLRRLGRLHSAAEARAAFDLARAAFSSVSFDLIYARQSQDAAAWRAELTDALAMAADHLSLYQLTIESGTAFGARHARGRLPGLPDDDCAAALFEMTQDITEAAGFPAYEVSNYARPGAEGRHNLIYWRGGDYLGIGPGAHGRRPGPKGRLATETPLAPEGWLRQVEATGCGEVATLLSPADVASEYLMMSLRLAEGSDLGRLDRLGWRPNAGTLDHLVELGLVDVANGRLSTTSRGRPLLNAMLRALLTE